MNNIIILNNLSKIAFLISIISVTTSIYFSEVLGYLPCSLCWWQRVCMYPLSIILGLGIIRKDRNSIYYALPLAILGVLVAFYQNLVYYGLVIHKAISCTPGISCADKTLTFFGFLSIPLMSLISFIVITTCLIGTMKISSKNDICNKH
jgi:disulfide bond formation protein DsbB